MERKEFKFHCKSINEEGIFQGYLTVFNTKDLDSWMPDIIRPGAFTKTLADHGGKVVLLDYHDPADRLGVLYLREDQKGLFVEKGVLNMDTSAGKEMLAEMKFYQEHGLQTEMSIGFDPVRYTFEEDAVTGKVTRILEECALWEGSLVTWGKMPGSQVTSVKAKNWQKAASYAASTVNDLIEGKSVSEAKAKRLRAAMASLTSAFEEIGALVAPAEGSADPPANKGTEPAAQEPPPAPAESHAAATVNADWISSFREKYL